jgi:hypothetical protein
MSAEGTVVQVEVVVAALLPGTDRFCFTGKRNFTIAGAPPELFVPPPVPADFSSPPGPDNVELVVR